MLRRDQKAFLGREDLWVLSKHKGKYKDAKFLGAGIPRGTGKIKGMDVALGRGLWLHSNVTCAERPFQFGTAAAASFRGLQCAPLRAEQL